MTQQEEFLAAYIEAALWSSNDESTPSGGRPLDANYGREDLAPETLAQMEKDCAVFLEKCGDLLTDDNCEYTGCSPDAYAGHDFWLTRCGHGAGFWDGGWKEPAASELDKTARQFGHVDLYIGDDGLIYGA